MSYNRRQVDAKKVNNFVSKNDFNKGGFHGKSKKATRRNEKVELAQIDLTDEERWEVLQDELG